MSIDPQSLSQFQQQALGQAIYDPSAIQQIEQPDSQLQYDLPDYDSAIKGLLQKMQVLSDSIPDTTNVQVGTQGIYHLAQAIHLLAQSSSEEGEHVPARVQVRLNSAQLQMENSQKVHQMMLAEQDQQHQHQLQIQQQAFEQQQAQQMQQAKIQQLQQAQSQQAQP